MRNGKARILAVGDVVGEAGTEYIKENLWHIRDLHSVDMVILNAENAAPGNGLDRETAEVLLRSGADVLTSGNHIWKRSAIRGLLDENEYILRPANYPGSCPGNGVCIFDMASYKVLVMNLQGTVYMESLASPFETADRILEREKGSFDLAFVDFHAEATSEKLALAKHLDGRITAFFGTHTHVQTADEKILPGGTGYITDLGMCAPEDSVLGVRNDIIIKHFLTKMPVKHEEAPGKAVMNACLFEVDLGTGKCKKVIRMRNAELAL